MNLELKIKVKLLFLLVTGRLACIHYLADWPVAVFPCFLLSCLSRPQVRCFPFHFLPALPPEVQAGQISQIPALTKLILTWISVFGAVISCKSFLAGHFQVCYIRLSKSTDIEDRVSWTAEWIFLWFVLERPLKYVIALGRNHAFTVAERLCVSII